MKKKIYMHTFSTLHNQKLSALLMSGERLGSEIDLLPVATYSLVFHNTAALKSVKSCIHISDLLFLIH